MTLLVFILEALIFLALYLFTKPRKNPHFEYAALIFGGAVAVRIIDGIVAWMEGDGFIDFSQIGIDLMLSALVTVLGLVLWGAILLVSHLVKKQKELNGSK